MVGVEQQGAGRTEERVLCLTRHAELSAGTGMCSCSLQIRRASREFRHSSICCPSSAIFMGCAAGVNASSEFFGSTGEWRRSFRISDDHKKRKKRPPHMEMTCG